MPNTIGRTVLGRSALFWRGSSVSVVGGCTAAGSRSFLHRFAWQLRVVLQVVKDDVDQIIGFVRREKEETDQQLVLPVVVPVLDVDERLYGLVGESQFHQRKRDRQGLGFRWLKLLVGLGVGGEDG